MVVQYRQYLHAKMEIEETSDRTTKKQLEEAINMAKDIVDEHGVWITRFLDLGEIQISNRLVVTMADLKHRLYQKFKIQSLDRSQSIKQHAIG